MNMPRDKWKRFTRQCVALLFAAIGCGAALQADAANVTFIAGAMNGVTNSDVVVPIRVRQFANVSSFQFSFHWNTNVATYVGVERFGLPGLTNNNESFGTIFTNAGTLTVAWFEPEGGAASLPDDSTIFGVRLRLIGPPAATSVTTIDGTPTAMDAGDDALNHLTVIASNGTLNVDHTLLYVCAGNKTIECGTAWNFDPPTIFDSCSTSTNGVTINVLSSVTNLNGTCGYTAVRTWELIDQCSNRTTCSQVVTAVDTTVPSVVCAGDKTIEFGVAWNFDAPTATDNCTLPANLATVIVGTSTNRNGFCWPAFSATRIWRISDGCNNFSTCTQTVTLRDTTAPQITSPATKIVNCLANWNFDPPTAIDVASGSNIPPVVISTSTNGTCGAGFLATRVWQAIDFCGNSVTATQTVAGRSLVDISGTIFVPTNYPATLNEKRVASATILGPSNAVTAADGAYHCLFDSANNVTITPQPPGGNPADGVTTLDISLVRRHILSVATLDSPYKVLAADVDGSLSISTLDLSYMRRLILGTTNRFPLGLWKFIPANHNFANQAAPWNPPTNRAYASVIGDVAGQDYVAIKLGDVNNSWTPPASVAPAPPAPKTAAKASGTTSSFDAGASVIISIAQTNAWPGNEVVVPLRVTNFTNVVGFQFSLHWTQSVAAFVGLEQFGVPFNATMYNAAMTNSGTLTVAWNDETGGSSSLPDGSVLFAMRFRCVGAPSNTTAITLDGIPTSFEIAADNQVVPSSAIPGGILLDQPNRAPQIANVTDKTIDEENLLSFFVNASDLDTGQTLTFSLEPGAPSGASINPSNGAFSWTPTEAQGAGMYAISVRVTDNGTPTPLSDTKTFNVQVNEVNIAPTAATEGFVTTEDTQLSVAAPGVLANDSDADGNPLSAVLVSGVTHGALTLNANGSFTYTPSSNYYGADSFIYRASDGVAFSPQVTVTITIQSANDTPLAVNDSQYTTTEDTTLVIPAVSGVLLNDSDADGDLITTVLASTTTNGTLTLGGNGSFSYTPNQNFNGVDRFTYRATDGIATSAVAVVTINVTPVNDLPVAAGESFTTDEDTVLNQSVPGVLANDSDVDGDTLTALLATTTTRGTLTLNGNGSFVYRPATNFSGNDSFTYRVTDGQSTSAVMTASITVRSVNDVPVPLTDTYAINEDTALHVNTPGLLGNDSDQDGDGLTASVVTLPTHGTLTLNANGSFDYLPATNYNGGDSFTYRVSDGQTTSPPATVTINITAINDAPIASNDSYTTDEDTPLTIAAPGTLANDLDVDGDTLTASIVSTTTKGTLSLNANGSFTYTPGTNFNGTDSFTYRVSDGTINSGVATATITVRGVNDLPFASNQVYLAVEDTMLIVPAAVGVLSNAFDADGDALTAALVTTTTNGTLTFQTNGAFTYLAATNFNGSDQFTYRVSDGTSTSTIATVTIVISAVNDVPLAGSDSYTVDEDTLLSVAAPGVLANDNDGDGQGLTAVLVGNPSHGSVVLNANGSFNYTPAANYFGVDSFTYRASDGATNSPVSTVTIAITGLNDPPITRDDTYAAQEDKLLTINVAQGVLTNDVDPDGDAMTVLLMNTTTNGVLTLQTNGSFTYMPNSNFNGVDHFVYRVIDSLTVSGYAVVTINVASVNDAPIVVNDSYSTSEDTPLIAGPGVLANDSDGDGDAISAVLVTGAAHGVVNLNANGSFTYTPVLNFNGLDSFTYRATDGTTNSAVATVSISVNALNDAPAGAPDSYVINEDSVLTLSAPGVLSNDSDADGDTLVASLASAPTHGVLTLNANGSLTYTPASNFSGVDSFTYRASDGQATSLETVVTITVSSRNDPPAIAALSMKRARHGDMVTFTASATDLDSQKLTFSLDAAPAGASIDPVSGAFAWMANTPGPKTNWVTVRVTDDGSPAQSATATLPIIVDESIHATIEDVTVPGGTTGTLEALFQVTLSAPCSQPVSIDFATADDTAIAGTDYTASSGTLVFAPGVTNQTIDVSVNGSSGIHSNRTFFVLLNNSTNTVLDRTEALGLISAEPATGLSVSDVSVSENAGTASFAVTLWPPSEVTVTVRYAAAKGTALSGKDFKPKRGTLKFLPGQTNLVINVPVVNDTLSEENETFTVTLSKSVNAVIAAPIATGTIVDDDPLPSVSITDATTVETDSGQRAMVFTVQLSAKSGRAISVDFATVDDTAVSGADYTGWSSTLSFPPGLTIKKFGVWILGDKAAEGGERFFVNLGNPVNATIADGQATATIRDNEPASTR